MMEIERRNRRSTQPSQALTFQLQACAERSGCRAMLLSDEDGLLVAGSPWSSDDAEEMAAMLPFLARGGEFAGILLGEQSVGRAVQVQSFDAVDTGLFICAIGRAGETVGREIDAAITGVRRILQ